MAIQSCPRKLWEHPNPHSTNMGRFRSALERSTGRSFITFNDLYSYSISHRPEFWDFCWRSFKIIHGGTCSTAFDESIRMDSIPSWFQGTKLNFAENLLSCSQGEIGKEHSKIAVTEVREGEAHNAQHVSWNDLRCKVGRLAQAMRASGIAKGDRIAACASNSIDTLVVFLATTSLGGIFSSSSTDMGVKGLLDRLLQIKPRLLFMDDWSLYNGKSIDLREKMREIASAMLDIQEFQGVISQPRFPSRPANITSIPRAQTLASFLTLARTNHLEFERIEFRDPALIAFSSGTTGRPKCIVHSAGGLLINAHKEGGLHLEHGPESVVLQYTTTGWIMYLLSVQNLLFGSRVVLYDGSPFTPDMESLIRLAEQERVTHLGISPRYLHELQRRHIRPRDIANLSKLKIVTSTGMVLSDALFNWFYDDGFPADVQLSNISGGTEIAGCFGISNSLSPIYLGGCSGRSLGIPLSVFDASFDGGKGASGIPVEDGVPGELVATAAFPNMPVAFWGPNGRQRYHDTYFARFDNVWTHGDFVMIHPITKQLIFLGRTDGVLNPSGVRFGSADIYRVIESRFSSEIKDSLCVGQKRDGDSDERVMLFLLMKPGIPFTLSIVERVKASIRAELSPRHVPTFIFQTPEIPVTINLKKIELPVKKIVSGHRVEPSGTLLNPCSLEYYYRFAQVENLHALKSKI